MRVLFVTSERGMRGGEGQVLLLRDELVRRGWEVGLCARAGAELLGAFDRARGCPMANELDPRGLFAVRRQARAFGADLVHAFTARAQALSLGCGRPLVVTRAVAFRAGKGLLGGFKYRAQAEYVAVSRAAARELERAGVPPDRIRVIPPALRVDGVSRDRAAARAKLGLDEGQCAIGFLGALEREKGVGDLIAGFGELLRERPAVLCLIGSGSLEAGLRAQASALPAGSVRFLGRRADAQALLAGFDLYVQPSRAEGFGLAAAEAMAAGVPVVASATGGLCDLIEDGRTGLLTPPGDPAGLARRMREVLADGEGARARARAARAMVCDRLAPEAMAVATLEVYRRALAK